MTNQTHQPDLDRRSEPPSGARTPSASSATRTPKARSRLLSPEEAETVIAQVRAEHGLGARYARKVSLGDGDQWTIVGRGRHVKVPAMTESELRDWLVREHFVEAIAEHDATTEG